MGPPQHLRASRGAMAAHAGPRGGRPPGTDDNGPMHGPLPQFKNEDTDEWLARNLLEMLRHRAASSGLHPDAGGWVRVDDLLRHRAMRRLDMQFLQKVAANRVDLYSRKFQVQPQEGAITDIRAVQGHTMPHVQPEAMGDVINPAATQALRLYHCTPLELWESGRLGHGLVAGSATGQSAHALIYMTVSLERFHRLGGNARPHIALELDAEAIHRLGITLFRTFKGDVISRGPIPFNCFVSATERQGMHCRERWNRRDGPPTFPRSTAATPAAAAQAGEGSDRGRPAQGGGLLARAQQLQWPATRLGPAARRRARRAQPIGSAPQRPRRPAANSAGTPANAVTGGRGPRQAVTPPRARSRDSHGSGGPRRGARRSPSPRGKRSRSRSRTPWSAGPASPIVLWHAVPEVLIIGNLEYVLSARSRENARNWAADRQRAAPSRSPVRLVRERGASARPMSVTARRRRSPGHGSSSDDRG